MRANPVKTLKKFRDVKEARNGMYVDTYNDYVKMAVGGASKNNVDEVCKVDLASGGPPRCRRTLKQRMQANKIKRKTRRSKRKANRTFKGGRRY
jgi:hypothetical protein